MTKVHIAVMVYRKILPKYFLNLKKISICFIILQKISTIQLSPKSIDKMAPESYALLQWATSLIYW